MKKTPAICRKVLKWMEIITIFIMVGIFFTGMFSNLSLNKTLDAFAHKNIFTKQMKFSERSPQGNEVEVLQQLLPLKKQQQNDTNTNILHRLFSKNSNSMNSNENLSNTITSSETQNRTPKNVKIKRNIQSTNSEWPSSSKEDLTEQVSVNKTKLTDEEFLEKMQLDLYTIQARKKSLQEYLLYYPLITLIVATSWGALLLCFRSNGYCNDEWVTIGPWRIVIPSVVCFTVMSIASAVYVFLSNKYSNRLCDNLRSELSYPENYTCDYLLEKLAPLRPFHVFPTSTQFKIYRITIKIDLILWLLALCLMTVRWLLAIDFELVKIALCPYYRDETKAYDSEFDEPTTTIATKITNLDSVRIADELPKKSSTVSSSKDDLDDFQSAHSNLNGVGGGGGGDGGSSGSHEFSSLEPLIIQNHNAESESNKNENLIQTDSV